MFSGYLRPEEAVRFAYLYGSPTVSGTPTDIWINFLQGATGRMSFDVAELEDAYLPGSGSIYDRLASFFASSSLSVQDAARSISSGSQNSTNPNPLFVSRTGNDFSSWTEVVAGTSTITADTTQSVEGGVSAKLSVDASNSSCQIQLDSTFPCKASTKYRFVCRAKSDTAGQLQVGFQDGGTNFLQANKTAWGGVQAFFDLDTTTSWKTFIIDFSTDVGQTGLRIVPLKRSGTATQASRIFWVDKAQIFPI